MLYETEPSVGIVVGTFAAAPYIHLHLEAWRRFYPDCPLLVHDDCSHEIPKLNSLCAEYGADFTTTTTPQGHIFGDTSCFWQGLLWAERRKVDILVKLSRRFLPLNSFVPSLKALALESQHATFSNVCQSWGFGFRTESMGMHVKTWLSKHLLPDLRQRIKDRNMLNGLPESFWHTWSSNLFPPCSEAIEWNNAKGSRENYAVWDWIGTGRGIRNPNFYWHQTHGPREYRELARSWGLDYRVREFCL